MVKNVAKFVVVFKNILRPSRTWPNSLNHSQCSFPRRFCPRVWGSHPNNSSSRRGLSPGRRLQGRAFSSPTPSTRSPSTLLRRLSQGSRSVWSTRWWAWGSLRLSDLWCSLRLSLSFEGLESAIRPHTFVWLVLCRGWCLLLRILNFIGHWILNAVEIVLIIYKTRVMMSMVLMLMLMLARADIHLQQTFPTVPHLICSSSGQLIY